MLMFILGALAGFAIGICTIIFGYVVYVNATEGRREKIDYHDLRSRGL
jgi:hypothetical protein